MKSRDASISPAMEDYLETIYLLVGERKVARVRDIAKARSVRPGSVTPAMQKLGRMGLIRYTQREYIDLTPEGEEVARRTLARHELLRRFFQDVLRTSAQNARADACSMEHYLSDEGMDRLTRLFEFIQRCPRSRDEFLDLIHTCPIVNPGQPSCDKVCSAIPGTRPGHTEGQSLSTLEPGETGTVIRVNAQGAMRSRLLDKGLIPMTHIEVVRCSRSDGSMTILVNGQQTGLSRREAGNVVVVP